MAYVPFTRTVQTGNTAATAAPDAGATEAQPWALLGDLVQAVNPIRQSVEETIATHPLGVMGVSFAVGVLLGWIIKRS